MRPFAAVSLAVCALALLPICCAAFAQEAQVVDGIAAIVNGDVITYSQVRQLSAPREKLLRSQFTGQDLENKVKGVRELALKDLIDRRLIIQAFKKESYQIPDHIVDQRCTTSFGRALAATATRLSRRSKHRITRWASSKKRRWSE